MGKKTINFLRFSLIAIVVFCVAIFIWMCNYMLRENEKTMDQVCKIYTSEMSDQLENHFTSIVDLCQTMAEGIPQRTPPDSVSEYGEEFEKDMKLNGQIRNFTYLALYAEDGHLDIIYGKPVTMNNEELFRTSLANEKETVTVTGTTSSGDNIMLFGTNAAYPMKDGGKSIALVAGLPIEYLNSSMWLMKGRSLVYSHIIRKDGTYVLRNNNTHSDNYLDWLQTVTFDDKTPEETVAEFKDAMSKNEDYSMMATVNGQRRFMYCEPLENSGWYLVTVLLYGTLDQTVADLGDKHLFAAITSCGAILILLALVFFLYFRISRRQLVETENEKHRADRANLAKSEFLSNMSHDIRTPMNAIVGMTAIAKANIDNKSAVEDALDRITLSSNHLLGLINDILDMSKIETGKLTINSEQISLVDVIRGVVNIIQPQIQTKNLKFDIYIRDIQCETIYSDSVRLNQILINLLSNAIKYTPEEGSISVSITQEDSQKGEKYVRTHIRVKDNGIGMSDEFQKRIFDSFVREDNRRIKQIEGSGLGMAITKYIVDAMKGTIKVKSELEKGSEFHVCLDFEKFSVREQDMMLPDLKLLFVDDSKQSCQNAVKTLREMKIQADWATSGLQAIEMAKENYENGDCYQAALLDWKMPDMDGIEIAKQLRTLLGENSAMLLISAYDWGDIESEAKAAGIDGFLCKPLFKSTLYHGLAPYFKPEEDFSNQNTDEPTFDFTGKRLLVAEDYDLNWEICQSLLSAYGFELDWAENGQLCVEMFTSREPGYYDAVLMDLRMPVADGYQATTQIRSSDRPDADIPIIAMTADAFSEDIKRCLECGMNAHVAKPLDMKKLLHMLEKYIGE